jgi:NAD(P)-dependent dehydrogenase (short-subunit alcohol dehydrogenase family)
MSRLNGKVAIVTGGGNGLGEAIATRMSEEGAAIAILDRDERGREVAEKLAASGAKAIFRQVDVTQEEQVSASFADVAQEFGSVTTLVNNAGIEGVNKPTDQLELADWEKVMAVNSTAVFLCTKHVIPHLRAAGAGSIITSRRSTASSAAATFRPTTLPRERSAS